MVYSKGGKMTQLLAYHDDPQIKDKYVNRVRAHAKADEIVKGFYWKDGKGCAVGCSVHSDNHTAYETEMGIPQMLARLEDRIFEGSTNGWSKQWPERFLEAIPIGADLSKVGWKFQHWLLLDPKEGVIRFARQQDKELFKEIGTLIWDLAMGKQISASAAWSAAWSAESAAWSAESAAWSAESAAWSAESAARSAESAAWSAESAAWSAASAERSAERS